jgi:hypothetical protein
MFGREVLMSVYESGMQEVVVEWGKNIIPLPV